MAPLRLDLHVHSLHSPDSTLTLEEAVAAIRARGLAGFALTDHNSLAGHAELAELQTRNPDLLLVPGVEVSTSEGHLLLYAPGERPPVLRPLSETLAWARHRGAVASLAHPFRVPHGAGGRWARTAPVDALETVNGHNRASTNARAERIARDRGVAATGGSDAHAAADVGRAYTEFPEGTEALPAVLTALRAGRTRAGGIPLGLAEAIAVRFRSGGLRAVRGFEPL
jgi:predicted metal-dependent phosphoesterase TrpH